MSEQLYKQMRQLLEHIEHPCEDERIERLRQAIVKHDVAMFKERAHQCVNDGVLPPGFITRLVKRHSLSVDELRSTPAALAEITPSRSRRTVNVIRRAAHAGTSIAKISLGIHRATDEQVEARLNVCRQCPGGHAIRRDDDVYTCGPMLESMKRTGQGTCGCVLRKKARDLKEECPFGYWSKAR